MANNVIANKDSRDMVLCSDSSIAPPNSYNSLRHYDPLEHENYFHFENNQQEETKKSSTITIEDTLSECYGYVDPCGIN